MFLVACNNPELLILLKQIIQLNPALRPTAQECLQNKYFLTPVQMSIDYKPPMPDSHEQDPQLQFKTDLELDQLFGHTELEILNA